MSLEVGKAEEPVVRVLICPSFTNVFEGGYWEDDEKLDPVPEYKTKLAAGADLYSTGSYVLAPGDVVDIPIGVALEIPEGYEGEIRGRSGYWFGNRVAGFNGTIDADYRDEIKVSLINHGQRSVIIKPGFRVGQIVYKRVEQLRHVIVQELGASERLGGFGHTGGF